MVYTNQPIEKRKQSDFAHNKNENNGKSDNKGGTKVSKKLLTSRWIIMQIQKL